MAIKITLKQKIFLVIFGLFLSAVLIEIGLRLAGFTYLFLQEQRNEASLRQKDAYRILCLGGSTTAGGGSEDSYPSQLEQILNQRIPGRQFSVINKGVPGINTVGILRQLKHNLDKYQPDMVIVMMGVNDRPHRILSFNRIINFFNSLRICKVAKLFWERTREVNILAELYLERGRDWQQQHDCLFAEEMFKKSIELTPQDARAYIELVNCYRELGRFTQAEEMAKKLEELAPQDPMAYIQLGSCYGDKGKLAQAEEMFKKAVEINPKLDKGYFELGWHYQYQHNYSQAEEMFKKAIAVAPENERGYVELGWCYQEDGKFALAEEMFKKVIEIKPKVDLNYLELGWYYQEHQKYSQAEEIFKKALSINRHNEQVYVSLELLSQAQGKYQEAELYHNKAGLITERRIKAIRPNYQKLKDIVLKRGIKLVYMQYPLRSIRFLKEMLGTASGIIYVDNEGIFQEALKNAKYEDYFTDRFAGDFGHCTVKGNWLIANNITEVLLREYFSSSASQDER